MRDDNVEITFGWFELPMLKSNVYGKKLLRLRLTVGCLADSKMVGSSKVVFLNITNIIRFFCFSLDRNDFFLLVDTFHFKDATYLAFTY